jgi:hypothetical protein
VVFSYVVDEKNDGNLTDFCSFYALPSNVLHWTADDEEQQKLLDTEPGAIVTNKHGKELKKGYDQIRAAYSFYCVIKDNDSERHKLVMKSMLAQAAKIGYDVFNMVEVL